MSKRYFVCKKYDGVRRGGEAAANRGRFDTAYHPKYTSDTEDSRELCSPTLG